MPLTRVATLLSDARPDETVTAKGWVRTRRDSKNGFSFIELNDGSCMKNLQIVVDADVPGYSDSIKNVTTGASIAVEGTVKESPGKGQRIELHATSLNVLGTADPATFPLQKKGHSFEFLREIAHLRPRSNSFGAVARVRNCISRSIHNFFQTRGFLYLNTPIITTSDCEGAGEMFQVTTLDMAKLAQRQTEIDWKQDFFGKPASLTVSGQLEAETYATSVGDCYTFGPTFRAENSNTTRHLAEFWMVEPEMPFYELPDNMDLAEAFIKTIINDVLAQCPEDMEFFNQRIDKTVLETLENIRTNEFVRLSYTEAVDLLKSCGKKFEYPVEWGIDLQSEHERFLTEEHFKQPVILFDYPRTIKPFYMRCNDDDKTVRAMDVLVPRVGEIIGGSQREERLDVLLARIEECGMNPDDYWWYTDLRRYGTVPHSGFGLGLERAVQLITGMTNIRDVIPFPRTPGHAEF
ncbi:asparagine--tRNA ligase [Fuerstiella marisgermanici]|uniref:Asparagine--tRNA ligase n=1 Tax=Fuerstiella marisgermanici TaxID=1891926 RepID=A0A1P8WL50_9PLAN|nr:asparagine--tRNA ligase [Fuerstiella marisgermanici]APZ94775.1 Asparagine--tRNA ligase [Fuerstiella marisgermanici]